MRELSPRIAKKIFAGTCARISFHVQNINMADETNESCSFHEMGLDDRLVKVNYILVIKIDQNYFNIHVYFCFLY